MKIQDFSNIKYIVSAFVLLTISVSGLFFISWNIYIKTGNYPFILLFFFSIILLLIIFLFFQYINNYPVNKIRNNLKNEISSEVNKASLSDNKEVQYIRPYDIAQKIKQETIQKLSKPGFATILKSLASEFNIMQGVVFLYNPEHSLFEVSEEYAIAPENRALPFRAGEGIHGQAALDMQVMKLSNLSKTYRLLASGLGSTYARFLYLTPIIYEDQCIALIEFSTLSDIGNNGLEILKILSNELGKELFSLTNMCHEA